MYRHTKEATPRARKKASRKRECFRDAQQNIFKKKAASYSPALHCSTIGAGGLNFSVRNGKRWDTAAITTWNVSFHYTLLSGIIRQERVRVTYWTRQTERAQRSPNRLKLWSAAGIRTCPVRTGGIPKAKVFGPLVRLGFDVAVFTPASYQRRSLRRPYKEL